MTVMGFQNKKFGLGDGWVGGVSSIQFVWDVEEDVTDLYDAPQINQKYAMVSGVGHG